MTFNEKMDMLDLIMIALKEHEKKLSKLINKLEMLVVNKNG